MNATAKIKFKKNKKSLGQFANLPTAFKNAPKGATNKAAVLAKIDVLKATPGKQLQEAASQIMLLNRYNLKYEKRTELVNAIIVAVYAVMSKYYKQYQTNLVSLPESKERREIVLACVSIAEQAAIAYRHHFRDIYSSSMIGYRRNRDKCVELGIRILELIRIEQRFRALRHQKLTPSSWQDVNRVFFTLLFHGDVEESQNLFGRIGTWSRKSTTQQKAQSSVLRLYVSIQLFGLLDAPSWSTRLFHTPDAYLETVSNGITIYQDDGAELEPGWLATNIDHKGPPLFQRESFFVEPSVKIEYSNLYNRLIKDYEELAKMKFIGRIEQDKLSKPLHDLESIERFPLLETMLFGLRPRERKQKRHAAFGHETLKIIFGYPNTYRALNELACEAVGRITRTSEFQENLTGLSAVMSDKASAINNTKWEIVNFSTGGILVLTRESAYTNPIQIGQIVAFNPNAEVKRPLLGYVSRINRPSEQQVEVAIVRFANHAESAILYDSRFAGNKGAAVMIFQGLEGKWCLIARHGYDLLPGSPFKLQREDGGTMPARLGNVMLSKQEFVVYELSSPGLK